MFSCSHTDAIVLAPAQAVEQGRVAEQNRAALEASIPGVVLAEPCMCLTSVINKVLDSTWSINGALVVTEF